MKSKTRISFSRIISVAYLESHDNTTNPWPSLSSILLKILILTLAKYKRSISKCHDLKSDYLIIWLSTSKKLREKSKIINHPSNLRQLRFLESTVISFKVWIPVPTTAETFAGLGGGLRNMRPTDPTANPQLTRRLTLQRCSALAILWQLLWLTPNSWLFIYFAYRQQLHDFNTACNLDSWFQHSL